MTKSDVFIICVVFVLCVASSWFGYQVGHREGKMVPCEDIVLEEITNLQKDIMACQAANLITLIRIVYLEDWRNSILFRPPELTDMDKKILRESIEKQRKELEDGLPKRDN